MSTPASTLLEEPRARRIVDLFRALATLLVILFHVIYGLIRLLPEEERFRFTAEFPGVLSVAWQALGSELIFVFSGFLIAYILIAEYRARGGIDYIPYLWKRAARILPLYYLALVFYTLTLQPDLPNILASAVFLGFILRGESVIPVGWSMEAMVQVYILLPLLVAYVMRGARPALRILLLIAASILVRFLFVALTESPFQPLFLDAIATTKFNDAAAELYFMAWFRATPFLIGLGLAWLVLERAEALNAAFARPVIWLPALLWGLLLMAGSGWLPVQTGESWLYQVTGEPFWRGYWAFQRAIFATGGTLVALTLFHAPPFRAPWLFRVLDAGPWRVIAQNIYGIYLFHFLFVLVAAVIVFRSTDEAVLYDATVWHVLAVFVVASALSTLAAMGLRRWVEIPARDWITNRFIRGKAAKPRAGIRP